MEEYRNDLIYKDFIILKSEFQIKYFIFLLLKCNLFLGIGRYENFTLFKSDILFTQAILKRLNTYAGFNILETASELLEFNTEHQKEKLLKQNKILFDLSCKIYDSIKQKNNKKQLIFLFNYQHKKILSNFHGNEASIFKEIMIKDKGITSKINFKEQDVKDFSYALKRQELKSVYQGLNNISSGDFSTFLKSFGRYMFDNDEEKRKRFFEYAESTKMKNTEILLLFKEKTKFNNKI